MKVAICLPVHRYTEALFTFSLAEMVAHSLKTASGLEIRSFMVRGVDPAQARERLAQNALNWAADWVLFLDADHVFPPTTLLRLLAHDADVIGLNQPRRAEPTAPTTWRDGSLVWTTLELAGAGAVEKVDFLGFGVCLVRASVFDSLTRPWFWFEQGSDGSLLTEDYYFCKRARAAGIPVRVDHGLSWEVGHLDEVVLTNARVLADRDRWIQSRKPPEP